MTKKNINMTKKNIKSPVERALACKPERYLLGFVVATTYQNTKVTPNKQKTWSGPKESLDNFVHRSQGAAQGCRSDHPVYVRGYCYSTPNPDNAKGLRDTKVLEKVSVRPR